MRAAKKDQVIFGDPGGFEMASFTRWATVSGIRANPAFGGAG